MGWVSCFFLYEISFPQRYFVFALEILSLCVIGSGALWYNSTRRDLAAVIKSAALAADLITAARSLPGRLR